ncbi:MAG: hypothetical protein JJU27_18425 [Gammaproteobacteria bacterium]|nr:hypothetical protein [Gammaproteobacteria bacterium]
MKITEHKDGLPIPMLSGNSKVSQDLVKVAVLIIENSRQLVVASRRIRLSLHRRAALTLGFRDIYPGKRLARRDRIRIRRMSGQQIACGRLVRMQRL